MHAAHAYVRVPVLHPPADARATGPLDCEAARGYPVAESSSQRGDSELVRGVPPTPHGSVPVSGGTSGVGGGDSSTTPQRALMVQAVAAFSQVHASPDAVNTGSTMRSSVHSAVHSAHSWLPGGGGGADGGAAAGGGAGGDGAAGRCPVLQLAAIDNAVAVGALVGARGRAGHAAQDAARDAALRAGGRGHVLREEHA